MAEPPVFLGLYPGGALQNTAGQAQTIDAWTASTGRRTALAGTFMDLEFPNPNWNVPAENEAAWSRGYLPVINLMTSRTSAQVAAGLIDSAITTWAGYFAVWAATGKRAFLLPFPEMNGNWTPYYGTPANFKAAYRRLKNLFLTTLRARGVTHHAISWIFGPSGWSFPSDTFERFYPGHDDVDVIGVSAYNFGGCPAVGQHWETYPTLFKPHLDRMAAMAPGKPIWLTQTGTVDRPVSGVGNKDAWLRDSYAKLAAYPRFRGIMYFNYVKTEVGMQNCVPTDWRVYVPGTPNWQGYKDALATTPAFGYWPPWSPEVTQVVMAPTVPHVYSDVHPVHPWALESGETDYSPWIHVLAAHGIIAPCSTDLTRYCPTDSVTRTQMALFLERGMRGGGYVPPAASGTTFADVTLTTPDAAWIEQLYRDGVTGGCATNPLRYCPNDKVTRAQMAVFLLRAKYGATYVPPPATGTMFTDVPATIWYTPWVERLAVEGITAGCGGGKYCPDDFVLRQQMAVFLVRTFALSMP